MEHATTGTESSMICKGPLHPSACSLAGAQPFVVKIRRAQKPGSLTFCVNNALETSVLAPTYIGPRGLWL
ncbi:hypothetical protein RvY_07281 [Ramazzottius varieornatus]|uniref:Uncharacterized protein n=1 Tax=Ramazzottius varieornatus TaxID=947166 RepID=A0A1D1V4R7_RAMVA|nr:hypothetical protein RvY_07281 [Ramazzottius varieornatus]